MAMEVVEFEPPQEPNPIEIPQTTSFSSSSSSSSPPPSQNQIPTEIISDEEMSLIEAAFSLAFKSRPSESSLISSLHFHRDSASITLHSKRSFSNYSTTSDCVSDIEDGIGIRKSQKKTVNESLLYRFRRKTGLFVTDITSTEWCDKQKEFYLVCGKPKATNAMKAGTARHAVLEEEVITRVEVVIKSAEEHWALKMINFIHGTNQLLMDGLTRELPLIGFAEGVCVVGIIDEIRMTRCVPTLVETKTRSQNNLPSEPQQRNGRLQLMCYKYLWDNLLANPFPSKKFLESFSLNPDYELSKQIQETAVQAGLPSPQTLNDVLRRYEYVCSMLPKTQDQLLLRYEYQKDQSLISENQFLYESDWVTDQIKSSLEFWKGNREASYVPEDERWKCKHCKYASRCPTQNPKSEQA